MKLIHYPYFKFLNNKIMKKTFSIPIMIGCVALLFSCTDTDVAPETSKNEISSLDPSTKAAEVFDVYVATNGLDTNDGATPTTPVATWARGLQLISSKGGAAGSKTMSVADGTYTTDEFLLLPVNLGKIKGTSYTSTILTGTPRLYNPFPSNQNGNLFLIQAVSSTPTTQTVSLIDFTVNGANRQILGGIYVNNRNDVELHQIYFKDFNFGGLYVANSNTGLVVNCNFFSSGGGNSGYSTGAVILNDVTNWEFSAGSINNVNYGTGYALKCLNEASGEINDITNVSIHGMQINMNPNGSYIDGNGNAIANINLEFTNDDVRLSNLSIYSNTFNGGFLSFGEKSSAAQNGDVNIYSNNFFPGTRSNGEKIAAIESHAHNLKVHDNYAVASSFMFTSNPYADFSASYSGWAVERNVIEVQQAGFDVGALVGLQNQPLVGALISNNTVIYTTTAGSINPPIVLKASAGPSSVTVQNNAISGQAPDPANGVSQRLFWTYVGAGLTDSFCKNNKATHVDTQQTMTGLTGGAANGNTKGHASLGFTNSGVKPDPFYKPTTGSVLIGTAYGGGDVGAITH
jgi:hypothetical protein